MTAQGGRTIIPKTSTNTKRTKTTEDLTKIATETEAEIEIGSATETEVEIGKEKNTGKRIKTKKRTVKGVGTVAGNGSPGLDHQTETAGEIAGRVRLVTVAKRVC